MNKLTTTTFLVSDVKPAATPLQETPYKEAVDALLRTADHGRRARSSTLRLVEACSRYH